MTFSGVISLFVSIEKLQLDNISMSCRLFGSGDDAAGIPENRAAHLA